MKTPENRISGECPERKTRGIKNPNWHKKLGVNRECAYNSDVSELKIEMLIIAEGKMMGGWEASNRVRGPWYPMRGTVHPEGQ